jgi:hypothetical protein
MHSITVSVVYALAECQWLYEARVPRGTSAGDLIEQSGFLNTVDELTGCSLQNLTLGVYSERVESDYLLQEGDRVELYRPLKADPKEVRRQLAMLGKTMGKK